MTTARLTAYETHITARRAAERAIGRYLVARHEAGQSVDNTMIIDGMTAEALIMLAPVSAKRAGAALRAMRARTLNTVPTALPVRGGNDGARMS